jgi:Anti-sigma-K factor rskA
VPHADPEVLALRALGESAGSAADEDHLAGCADCRAEIAQLAEVVAVARRGTSPAQLEQPPPQLWEQIAAAAGVASPTQMVTSPVPDQSQAPVPAGQPGDVPLVRRPVSGRRRMRVRLAAAAAAGIVVGAGAAVGISSLVSAPGSAAQAVAQVELQPLPQFPQWGSASGTAVMRQEAATRVLDVALHAPQRTGFYEVWLLGRDGTSMISLGDLPTSHAGAFTIPPGTDLRFYSRIDVSLQPFDGSTVHSKTSVVRGALPAVAISGTSS